MRCRKEHAYRNLISFRAVVICLASALLFSCADSEAGILAVNASVVFDYKDGFSAPETSLSVFVQTEHEAQRADSIKVMRPDEKISWTITEPVMIKNGDNEWAGYSVLLPAEGKAIENGEYRVVYTDAAGNEAEGLFTVNYKKELLSSNASSIRVSAGVSLSENVALFDKDMNMLFYGRAKSTWRTNPGILRDYSRAAYIRRVLSTSSGSLLFKQPLESLLDDEGGESAANGENKSSDGE